MNLPVRSPRRLLLAAAIVLALVSLPTTHRVPTVTAHADSGLALTSTLCLAHHPAPQYYYAPGCTGHDEPELDPVSSAPGSAQDLTWTVVLPSDGITVPVGLVGPTFWIGGSVSDPHSQFGQAFLELQFYPNSLVSACAPNGNYTVTYDRSVYTACAPVWAVYGQNELAAFNAMLVDSQGGPLLLHAGDTITDHQYVTSARDGMHITVTDVTTGHAGTIVLNSQRDGPLLPAYTQQKIGNDLKWGLVYDAPNSLVWEIGHTSNYAHPPGQFCLPGQAVHPACYSYNVPTWLGFHPVQIKGVTFGDGSRPRGWAVVSDYGGEAEVKQYCPTYGAPFCWYPWFAYNGALGALTYGGDYAGTSADFGQAGQFAQTTECPGPSGPRTFYCARALQ